MRTPTTTLSGFMKSSIAAPSFRNSGFEATSMGRFAFFDIRSIRVLLVPTGTVLLMTTTASGRKLAQSRSPTAQTAPRSALGH